MLVLRDPSDAEVMVDDMEAVETELEDDEERDSMGPDDDDVHRAEAGGTRLERAIRSRVPLELKEIACSAGLVLLAGVAAVDDAADNKLEPPVTLAGAAGVWWRVLFACGPSGTLFDATRFALATAALLTQLDFRFEAGGGTFAVEVLESTATGG